jgi:hypothetical protein
MAQPTRQCPLCGSADISEPRAVNQYGAKTVACAGCQAVMLPEAAVPGSCPFEQIVDHAAYAVRLARLAGWTPANEPGDGAGHSEMVDHLVTAWLDGDASVVLANGLGMDRVGMAASIATYAGMAGSAR